MRARLNDLRHMHIYLEETKQYENITNDEIIRLKLNHICPKILYENPRMFVVECRHDDFEYQWSYTYNIQFEYAYYTEKMLEKYPSIIISNILKKIPFNNNDIFCRYAQGEGYGSYPEDYKNYLDIYDFFRNIHADDMFPVYCDGNWYYLNQIQKIEYDMIMGAFGPIIYWSEGRKRVREGIPQIPGNDLLRVVDGLSRGAIAEVYMQISKIPHPSIRGVASGDT